MTAPALPDHTLNHNPEAAARRQARVRRVRLLVIALPVAAGLLLAACVLQVLLRDMVTPTPVARASVPSRMIAPHFAGSGSDGRTYTVSGREGVADQKDPGLILIDQPILKISSKARGETTMTALSGVFNEAENKLLLKGNVQVDNGQGSHFNSERAVIDTRTGEVTGREGLTARNPQAEVRAKDYTVMNEGDRMVLRGGVHGRITSTK